MKALATVLSAARSNLSGRLNGTAPTRGPYIKAGDDALLPVIRGFVDQRPTCCCRRFAASLNGECAKAGQQPINRKRIHRIMQRHAILLECHTGRRVGRVQDGNVMVMRSNLRWCSDGLEFTCWNGDVV